MSSLPMMSKIAATLFVALFPLINPIGTAFVLYGMVGRIDDRAWIAAARRIAAYTFLLLTLFFFIGEYILKLFGLAIPVVQFAGGLVVASIGWEILKQRDELQAGSSKPTADAAAQIEDRLFYPYTFPLTVGPGGLAVVMTFSAHLHRESGMPVTLEQMAAVAGILAICVLTSICYARLKWITRKFSPAGVQALTRILGFFVFCIGVGITWSGWRALNG